MSIIVRNTLPEDIPDLQALCRAVYPDASPYRHDQLLSQLRVFPQGQLVAVEEQTGGVIGMASSLVLLWDDYAIDGTWRDFTDSGAFTNHDPDGRTLYGAEVMVHPAHHGEGVGTALYAARRRVCGELGLLRIRAGARLAGYGRHAGRLTAEAYVRRVIRGELRDPTLSFQLGRGFTVIAVVEGYLRRDPESLGYAAVIEWLNPEVTTPADHRRSQARFPAGGPRDVEEALD